MGKKFRDYGGVYLIGGLLNTGFTVPQLKVLAWGIHICVNAAW